MTVTSDDVLRFASLIEARVGLRVGDRQVAMSELIARRSASHRESVPVYLRRVEDGDVDELRALAAEVSVGETYFFRHPEQCCAYAHLLSAIHRERGHVRVLSAGCSSGEEPYTLAILAREHVLDPRGVTIHGLDLNAAALARAAKGVYTRWALRATPHDIEGRWFSPIGRDVELARTIRAAVTFDEANLMTDAAWSRAAWDIVFCRNVTMYFNEVHAREVIERLLGSLALGGYLFLGHAETLRALPPGVELCHTHGTFYYRRGVPVGEPPRPPAAPHTDTFHAVWVHDIAAASQRVHDLVDGALARPAVAAGIPSLAPIRAMIVEERFGDALAALAELPTHNGEARLLEAVVLAQTGDATAETTCRELISANPHDASAHYLCSICANDAVVALRHAREAQCSDPSFAMAAIQLAFLARRAGDHGAAEDQLVRAIGLIEREDPARLALFAGGFSVAGLIELCRAELALARSTR